LRSSFESASADQPFRSIASCGDFLERFIDRKLPKSLRRFIGVSDLVQSVLFAAQRHEGTFRGNTAAEARAWLATIAKRKIVDGIRRYQKRHCCVRGSEWLVSVRGQVNQEDGYQRLAAEDDATVLLAAISELPELQRKVITHRYIDGMTFNEIASELQIAVTTCRRLWLDGIDQLGQRLETILI
jgi:RNA polymerase sigma factor (sigma-70 family)